MTLTTKTLLELIARRYQRMRIGLDTFTEFLLLFVDYAPILMKKKPGQHRLKYLVNRLRKEYLQEQCYIFKDIRLPLLDHVNESLFFGYVMEDSFLSYLKFDDCYDEDIMNIYYDLLPEGPYGLRNNFVDVSVSAGDIVIDAGSWIGDFAAYASTQASKVYAFEPSDHIYKYLLQTASLNKNIIPVKKGLGNRVSVEYFFHDTGYSLGDSVNADKTTDDDSTRIDITALDIFIAENKIPRVDFIKADIEGFERHMLEGAQETLRTFAPKLALCTYHLPDDPEIMSTLIKEANPHYNIVQKRKKLYASVPEKERMKIFDSKAIPFEVKDSRCR